jgi:predicted nucleotidyltransferase
MNDSFSAQLNDILSGTGEVEFAYLFGSCARGDSFPFSDIDIAVYLSRKSAPLNVELELHSVLSRKLKSNKVDLVVLNNTHNLMLLEEIVRFGKVVYDKNQSSREEFELKVLHDTIDFKYQRKLFAGI